MSVFVDLVALYEDAGFVVQSSLSPAHFPGFSLAELPFTFIHGDDGKLCVGGGISLSEITFFEALCEQLRPARIFIIGNAFGWSTLALGLINRAARVVAIDHCLRLGVRVFAAVLRHHFRQRLQSQRDLLLRSQRDVLLFASHRVVFGGALVR